MLFGLRNAAQTFQWLIDDVIHGPQFCFAYLDDILIARLDLNQQKQHLITLY